MLTGIFVLMLIGLIAKIGFMIFLVLFLAPKWVPMKRRRMVREIRKKKIKEEALREEIDTYAG
jgi:hypothetical protein